jgi:integrase
MSKPTGYIPQHCHHKPTGQGYVRLNGKALYTGAWGTPESQREYDRLVQEWISRGRAAPPTRRTDKYLIEDLLADYWVHAKTWYRRLDGTPTDELRNVRYALRPLRALYGDLPVDEFGPAQLKVYRDGRVTHGLCRGVVNQQVGVVRRVFNWAVSESKLRPEVGYALSSVKHLPFGRGGAKETEDVEAVLKADIEAVVPHVSRQVAAMIRLQELTGMRPGEVVIMRMADIDMNGKVWVYTPTQHKTKHLGKDRFIAIGPKGQAVLRGFFKLDREAFLFDPRDADAEHRDVKARTRKTKVSPSQRDRHRRAMEQPERVFNDRYSVMTYGRAIARGCELAEIERWTANQLRHTAATRIRKEYGIEAARVLLGHSSITTTEIYAEADRESMLKLMEQSG